MNFLTILIILSLIVSNKILLFNEEFLIFVAFVAFCLIGINKLSLLTKSTFQEKVDFDKNNLLKSVESKILRLKQKNQLNDVIKQSKDLFVHLKYYYVNSNSQYLKKLITFTRQQKSLFLQNQFNVLFNLENNNKKQILFLITDKLKTSIKVIKFLNTKLKISQYKTFAKLTLREYIKQI